MKLGDVLKIASWCYTWVDRETWQSLTDNGSWYDFVRSITSYLPEDMRKNIVETLERVPSYEEKQLFMAQVFTGGLPDSALPVESLYLPLKPSDQGPCYLRDSADYMNALTKSLGIVIPESFHATPDHLSLELEVASLLAKEGDEDLAQKFISERLMWLTDYVDVLEGIDIDASFYVALTRALAALSDAK